ncbi:glucose-1-phosphate adenylyltransferase subunit GlgD [uncultured Clostridium sp.]|jgi:glucose-1-phosphate adenylyltransferase|uniref:glucose-1-phosphate adenylyltransferase subunit GlgD n=1 Tax=uncultured Clostridium sp. TaxID=59620 RepID=UPI00262AE0B6|nr:glucose-1-phosphate adenylyltransferase subunit GlgD [uncultured Clostridium sp.]
MKNCVGIINLDEKENRMGELVRNRPLAAVPIAGRYRVVDFILSNMTNAGIESIGMFAKNKSRSLMDHISNGKPWDLNRKRDGLRVFNFADKDPSQEDVHGFCDNLEFAKLSKKEYVLLAPSYMIANIDFNEVMKQHKKSSNDITVVYKDITDAKSNFLGCDILNLDNTGRVLSVGENIGSDKKVKINMEMYLMRTDLFIDIVYACIKNGNIRKVKNYIKYNTESLNVGSYAFDGYVRCINSLDSYFKMNTDILNTEVTKELFYNNRPIYTKTKDESGTKYGENSNVINSIIANGSFIEGTVENCVISRRVYIGENTKLKNCVILQNTKIGDNVEMQNIITDKNVTIRDGEVLKGDNETPLVIKKKYKI